MVIVMGFLALMAFSVEAKNGLLAGLKNMVMFFLCLAAYFGMVILSVRVLIYFRVWTDVWRTFILRV